MAGRKKKKTILNEANTRLVRSLSAKLRGSGQGKAWKKRMRPLHVAALLLRHDRQVGAAFEAVNGLWQQRHGK